MTKSLMSSILEDSEISEAFRRDEQLRMLLDEFPPGATREDLLVLIQAIGETCTDQTNNRANLDTESLERLKVGWKVILTTLRHVTEQVTAEQQLVYDETDARRKAAS